MIEGFVVPHAHFRVFSSSAGGDAHLREFVQLEAQVKALTLSSSTPSSTAGALAELFTFYRRLLTADAFTWPDFLATVFAKLAEHFAARCVL